MTELSPAAQAVMEAYWDTPNEPITTQIHQAAVAAAIRAATDQVVPKDVDPSGDWTDKDEVRYQLLAIAAELENPEKSKRT